MSTIVHCLDGTSDECKAGTVGALKKEYERKNGVPVDTQSLWACSSGIEMEDAMTLTGETEVQLLIDRQTVTVYLSGIVYEENCVHESTVGDMCEALEAKHEFAIAFALDAEIYDATGVVSMDAVVPMDSPARNYLERPLHLESIRIFQSPGECTRSVFWGIYPLRVQMPWLRIKEFVPAVWWGGHTMYVDLNDDSQGGVRPELTIFKTWKTAVDKTIRVTTDSTLELSVPVQPSYPYCRVRNHDTGVQITVDPIEVLTRTRYVRGIIEYKFWKIGREKGIRCVANSLEYRRALPDAAAVY